MKAFNTVQEFTNGLEFPDTLAKKSTTLTSRDGTQMNKSFVDFIWGSTQAIMDRAGITPDGVLEAPGTSQIVESIESIAVDVNSSAIAENTWRFVKAGYFRGYVPSPEAVTTEYFALDIFEKTVDPGFSEYGIRVRDTKLFNFPIEIPPTTEIVLVQVDSVDKTTIVPLEDEFKRPLSLYYQPSSLSGFKLSVTWSGGVCGLVTPSGQHLNGGDVLGGFSKIKSIFLVN